MEKIYSANYNSWRLSTTMLRWGKMYLIFIKQYVKILFQSKLDFLLGVIAFLFNQVLGVVFLLLVSSKVPKLNDWNYDELLFMYGFFQIPKGIDHLLTDNLWTIAWYQIRVGKFDKYLLRPANLLFQIIAEKIQFDGLGEIALGITIMLKVMKNTGFVFDYREIMYMIISIILGATIWSSVKIIISSAAFWIKESGEMLQTVYQLSDYSKYPITIYPNIVKQIITYIIPFAWVAYYPSCYLLGKVTGVRMIFNQTLITLVVVIFAMFIFRLGVKKYESVGN